MKTFYHPEQLLHHPQTYLSRGQMRKPQEVPDRALAILRGLGTLGLEVNRPADHGMAPLQAVHSAPYLRFLETAHSEWKKMPADWGDEVMSNIFVREPNALRGILAQAAAYLADGSCPVGEFTWRSAYWAAQCAVAATEVVLAGGGPPARQVAALGEERGERLRGFHRDEVGQHVLRQREHHRAGPARGRDVEGTTDVLGQTPCIVHLIDPLGDVTEHLAVVDLLPRLASHGFPAHLTDEDDQRRRVLSRGMDGDARIGRARSARDEADARLTGELGVGLGHVRRTAFLAADDQPDGLARKVERVEHGEKTLARHAVGRVGAMDAQCVDQNLAAATGGKCGSCHGDSDRE